MCTLCPLSPKKIIFVEYSTLRWSVFWIVRPLRRVRIWNSPTGGTALVFPVSAGSFGGTDFPSRPEFRDVFPRTRRPWELRDFVKWFNFLNGEF